MKLKAIITLAGLAAVVAAQTPPQTNARLLGVPLKDGPHVPASQSFADAAEVSIQGTLIERVKTNWFEGTFKCGEADAVAFGTPFAVPIYAQEGSVTTMIQVRFIYGTNTFVYNSNHKATHDVMRYFRQEGTNMIVLTNSSWSHALP